MKNGKTALFCLVLSLFALFGCVEEAGIPEGWVEYDLPETGVKIALPPEYVLAAKELMPTDADYERAGMSEELREIFTRRTSGSFDDLPVNVSILSGKRFIAGAISMNEAPEIAEWVGADTTTPINIRRYEKQAFEMYRPYKEAGASFYKVNGYVLGDQLCYAVIESDRKNDEGVEYYERTYSALFEGRLIEIDWSVGKEWVDDALISEFDEAAKLLFVEGS